MAGDLPIVHRSHYCFPKFAMQLEMGFNNYRKIIEYAKNRINMFIINLQFGTHKMHLRTFKCIERAIQNIERNSYLDIEIGVLVEITNPKVITGLLKRRAESVYLDRDSTFVITADRRFSHQGSHEIVYANFKDSVGRLRVGDTIRIGGNVQVKVIEILVKTIICRIETPGLLKPRMEVFLPESAIHLEEYISAEEDEDIIFILEKTNCDYIICPCAHVYVCQHIHWFMATHQRRISVVGKINPELYEDESRIKKIVQEFSGVWIDRSGMQEPLYFEIALVKQCMMEGRFLMRSADYILDDIVRFPRDPGNCRNLLLYPDCLVLPSHLPTNIFPSKVRSIIRQSYPQMNVDTFEYCCTYMPPVRSAPNMLIRQIALNVIFAKVCCVIVASNSERSAIQLSQNRISIPIVASVPNEITARKLMIWKNVIPLVYLESIVSGWSEELNERIAFGVDYAKRYGYVTETDAFIVCFDSKHGLKWADTFRLVRLCQ